MDTAESVEKTGLQRFLVVQAFAADWPQGELGDQAGNWKGTLNAISRVRMYLWTGFAATVSL